MTETPEQHDSLSAPPRRLEPKAKKRLLREPLVRFWIMAAALIGLGFIFLTVEALMNYRSESRSLREGEVVDATGWQIGSARIKGRPLPIGEAIDVEYEYQGKKYATQGQLARTDQLYRAGEPFQVHIDPRSPATWTNRKEPAGMQEKLIGSVVTLFFFFVCLITAMVMRAGFARLWRDGDLRSAKVVEHRQTALAPRSVALYCAIRENRQEHLLTVYVPHSDSVPEVGQTLPVIANSAMTRAIAVMNYSNQS